MSVDTQALCADLLTTVKSRLESVAFMERHRHAPTAFTRKRTLPFVIVVLFIVNLVKRALQDELDAYFNLERHAVVAERVVTKSAFCQARQKLRASAFVELNTVQTQYFYQHFPYQTWHGWRLLAIDGSTAEVPVTPDIIAHFGYWGDKPLARVSQLFDVLNQLTLDAWIGPKTRDERECAAHHLAHVQRGDLLLLDRGYPAFWLFVRILSTGAHFCARMPLGLWNEVDHFVASGQREHIVTLTPGTHAQQECQARQLPTTPLQVRLLRITLDSGEIEVLATSLVDSTAYPYALFKELYHQRWPVEEDYKVIKLRAEVENWSGKSTLAVQQDFYAKLFTSNLTVILSQPAQTQVTQQSQTKRYAYRVNFAYALSIMKDTVVQLLRRSAIHDLLAALWQAMLRTTEPVRPGRKAPRRKGQRRKRFSMCYKSAR
jgi:hypothetical protein